VIQPADPQAALATGMAFAAGIGGSLWGWAGAISAASGQDKTGRSDGPDGGGRESALQTGETRAPAGVGSSSAGQKPRPTEPRRQRWK
jgi:hypothetical protein